MRIGVRVSIVGFVLLLPGSGIPSRSVPSTIAELIPLVFFGGLGVIAPGSVVVGLVAYRSKILPSALGSAYAGAIPAGVGFNSTMVVAGAGTGAFVIGLLVPFEIVLAVLGSYLSWTVR